MGRANLFVPSEVAYEVVSALGDVGLVQFIDVSVKQALCCCCSVVAVLLLLLPFAFFFFAFFFVPL